EDLKSQPRSVPLGTLRDLIQERGERLLTQLREGPIGRLIPGGSDAAVPPIPTVESAPPSMAPVTAQPHPSEPPKPSVRPGAPEPISAEGDKPKGRLTEIVESSKSTLDHWQHTIDERIRAILPGVGLFRELKDDVRRLTQRVEELEARLDGKAKD